MTTRTILPLLALLALPLGCDSDPLASEDPETVEPEKIVFSARPEGGAYHQIFTVNADGTDLLQVTFLAGRNARFPSWSPRGDSIVFVSDPVSAGAGDAEIYIAAADGSTHRPFMVDPIAILVGEFSVWSPAGDRLVTFHCGSCGPRKSSGNISVLPMEQAALEGLQSALRGYRRGGYPALSSDGAMLAFIDNDLLTSNDQIFTDQPDYFGATSAYKRITSTRMNKKTPIWAPDDTRIAFLSNTQIFIHDLGSGAEEEVTPVDNPAGRVPLSLHAWVGDAEGSLLVTYRDDNQDVPLQYYLYTLNVHSGALQLILSDSTLLGADWHLPR